MRQFELQLVKSKLVNQIETELWRVTGLRLEVFQFEELATFSVNDLQKLLVEMPLIETKFRQRYDNATNSD